MPPKKKPGRPKKKISSESSSAHDNDNSSHRRSNKRGQSSPVPNDKSNAKSSTSSNGVSSANKNNRQSDKNNDTDDSTMYAISHHTSFIPALQYPNPLITLNQAISTISTLPTTSSTVVGSNSSTSTSNNANLSNMFINYNLYHPRNLSAQSIPEVRDDVPSQTPHSAGCRMSSIAYPTWTNIPQTVVENNEEVVKCTTVMDANANYVAMGDTAGFVTLYSVLPIIRPIHILQTSISKRRFGNMSHRSNEDIPITKSSSHDAAITVNSSMTKKPKKNRASESILMCTIDRDFAIDCLAIANSGVVVGTKYEIEYVSFDNKIKWNLDICKSTENASGISDSNDCSRAIRKFHIDRGGILASFEVNYHETFLNTKETDSDGVCSEHLSPVWHIDTKSGQKVTIIPKEYVNNQWKDIVVGTKAVGIWDKSIPDANNILATFITQNQETKDAQQELLLLNNLHQVIFRAVLPTRSSGSKIITSEAINQSQKGTFSIAATSAKGGIRLYKTDGLVHLGTYGEGVSLHGHSIFWNDCFFIEMGQRDNDCGTNDVAIQRKYHQMDSDQSGLEGTDLSCDQEQWGLIFERRDELRHRGAIKSTETEKLKVGGEETLDGLHIVSVPHPFREPVDMKETIHFWDVSTCQLDGGNKLPSFTLAAPKKSGGIMSFLHDKSLPTSNGSRFLLSSYDGDCVQLTPTMTSDWAGSMYPTGYRVIDNNLVYIEDEDELDKVIDDAYCQDINNQWEDRVKNINNESELAAALHLSKIDETIDVVNGDTKDSADAVIISSKSRQDEIDVIPPCRPESRLKLKLQNLSNEDEDDTLIPSVSMLDGASARCDIQDILGLFPQHESAIEMLEMEKEKDCKRESLINTMLARDDDNADEKVPKPKSRLAIVEATIKASVDKTLSMSMLKRESFSNASGSLLDNIHEQSQNAANESVANVMCFACRGRRVIHSCGKRVRPIDYDAIEAAIKAKEEKERNAKLEAQAKKRKEAEIRRKEAKKRKLEEEKQAKLEQEKMKNEMIENLLDNQPKTENGPYHDSNENDQQSDRNNFSTNFISESIPESEHQLSTMATSIHTSIDTWNGSNQNSSQKQVLSVAESGQTSQINEIQNVMNEKDNETNHTLLFQNNLISSSDQIQQPQLYPSVHEGFIKSNPNNDG